MGIAFRLIVVLNWPHKNGHVKLSFFLPHGRRLLHSVAHSSFINSFCQLAQDFPPDYQRLEAKVYGSKPLGINKFPQGEREPYGINAFQVHLLVWNWDLNRFVLQMNNFFSDQAADPVFGEVDLSGVDV